MDREPGDHKLGRERSLTLKAGHGDRIVFGSDFLGAIEGSLTVIEAAPFSDEQKRDILYNNAARFLRLSDEQIEQPHGK